MIRVADYDLLNARAIVARPAYACHVRSALGCVLLAGCAYQAGSFSDYYGAFPGRHVALSCLDLGVQVRGEELEDPVVAYQLGNRCEHAVMVDLATVHVIARDLDGREVALTAYDPNHELRVLPLAASWGAREAIEYRGIAAANANEVCVDVGNIERGAQPAPARWICEVPR